MNRRGEEHVWHRMFSPAQYRHQAHAIHAWPDHHPGLPSKRPARCLLPGGSIAIAGALVQWVRDNLGLIKESREIEGLAQTVEDNGGIYFVPAFPALCPYWRSDARGAIVGLTRYVNKGHLARAVLEANAYQTRDIVEAMNQDSGVKLSKLKVDAGWSITTCSCSFWQIP